MFELKYVYHDNGKQLWVWMCSEPSCYGGADHKPHVHTGRGSKGRYVRRHPWQFFRTPLRRAVQLELLDAVRRKQGYQRAQAEQAELTSLRSEVLTWQKEPLLLATLKAKG